MNPRDLPSRDGYRFIGNFRDGSRRECMVELDNCGLYVVEDYDNLVSWEPINPTVGTPPEVKRKSIAP